MPPSPSRLLIRGAAALCAKLPLKGCLGFGRGLGWVYGNLVRYHRRDADQALAQAFPGWDARQRRQTVDAMYAHLGMNVAETLRLAGGNEDQLRSLIEIQGREHIKQALAGGRGALILTAHYGNWDLLSLTTTLLGYPLTIISKDIPLSAVNDYWMDFRRRYNLAIVPAHNSYRVCRTALRRNELIGFILDQNMIRKEGVFVDFFGRPACTTPGLAFMSAQAQAPVVPVFIRRLWPDRHLIELQPPIEPPPDREPETVAAATQRYTGIIEEQVRRAPEQWIWLHRRWRTTPPRDGDSD